ncbi:D-glycero-D-manno-heptose 1,7-bisphosphate phosphatase [Sphingopyxis panaciterrae]|uniref:D-glycero-alpha-D-manno-heptose-1,7-bisphosphate 7-phosphatase n=1 Tax=Sphingopyxis panaciterrae TaxID=363841 RepID=UPI00141EC8AB|nr:HAD family hydrolase [Sphingopyxis panaciterrae]NIJ38724.1 D-glycero-D-manno-heptose 1,7-bisphosphate phosphatase [Sphingopyxis panaciterrae]
MNRAALFLDRDGVLNVDHGYVFQARDFDLIDGVLDALRAAADRGYELIIVTNQSGIGRGYFSQADYDLLEVHMRGLFAAEGIPLAAIYHCPHHPNAGCACRKPQPGMILQAAHEHGIDLASSILIGDKPSDADAGRAAKVGRIELVTAHRTIVDIVAELQPARQGLSKKQEI